MESEIYQRVDASGSTEVRVSLAKHEGELFVDIRTFFADLKNVDTDGMIKFAQERGPEFFKPTYKGIHVRESVFMELMRGLLPLYENLKKTKEMGG